MHSHTYTPYQPPQPPPLPPSLPPSTPLLIAPPHGDDAGWTDPCTSASARGTWWHLQPTETCNPASTGSTFWLTPGSWVGIRVDGPAAVGSIVTSVEVKLAKASSDASGSLSIALLSSSGALRGTLTSVVDASSLTTYTGNGQVGRQPGVQLSQTTCSGWQGIYHNCDGGYTANCGDRYACGTGEYNKGFAWVAFSGALPAIQPLDRLALRFDPVNGQGTVAVVKSRWQNGHEMPGQWLGVHHMQDDIYDGYYQGFWCNGCLNAGTPSPGTQFDCCKYRVIGTEGGGRGVPASGFEGCRECLEFMSIKVMGLPAPPRPPPSPPPPSPSPPTPSPPPPSPSLPPSGSSGASGDPHLLFANGGKADFRGSHRDSYAFLSSPGYQVQS